MSITAGTTNIVAISIGGVVASAFITPSISVLHGLGSVDAGNAEAIQNRSLTSLREKLIKIGAKVVSHGRYIAFQMAEVAISRRPFGDILRLIATLRAPPIPATAI